MKVLQINALYGFGSTGRTTKELDCELQKNGIESIVAVTKTEERKENLYIIGDKLDWKIHAFMSRLTGKQAYFSKKATKNLLAYIDKEKPDIIHLRNLHGNYINVISLLEYISQNKIATVITLHDHWFFTGRCCHYIDSDCNRWQESCGNCPSLKKWNKSWFFDRSSEMLQDKKQHLSKISNLAVVGVSDWTTSEARKSILKSAKIVKRIYNWIDLENFYPRESSTLKQKLGIENDFVVLGVAHKWSEQKGLFRIIEVAKAKPEWKFVLIGQLPENVAIPSNIITVGLVNDVDLLVEYYSMADALLNPSTQETFGKTTAEAIACGTPVVGYNSTAIPELIGEGCGLVIELNSGSEVIINALDTIYNNGKEHYKEKCISFAKENFEKQKLINEYISLYSELIRG